MSFSTDVKDFMTGAYQNLRDCCKESFDLGADGKIAPLICKQCLAYYLSGVFYSYGTMVDPAKGYQLFIYPPEESKEFIYSLLEDCLTPSRGKSKGKECFYYKNKDGVGGFLALCRASPYALKVFEEGIERVEKARLQRFCNAEVANMDRASTAAAEQLSAIAYLKKTGAYNNIKDEYKEAAELREAYPETGLAELSRLSPKAISKSGLNYRFKRIIEMAKELKNELEPEEEQQ